MSSLLGVGEERWGNKSHDVSKYGRDGVRLNQNDHMDTERKENREAVEEYVSKSLKGMEISKMPCEMPYPYNVHGVLMYPRR